MCLDRWIASTGADYSRSCAIKLTKQGGIPQPRFVSDHCRVEKNSDPLQLPTILFHSSQALIDAVGLDYVSCDMLK